MEEQLSFGCSVILLLGGAVFLCLLLRPTPTIPVAFPSDEGDEAHDSIQFWTAIWVVLRSCYPFLPRPEIAELSPDAIATATVDALFERDPYGFDDEFGLPVPALPEVERRRHFYIVGKTGSGKSTFLEHLINDDMRAGRGVVVISPEGEFFRDRLLHIVPPWRERDLIYFAPSNPKSTITINPMQCEPGDDPLHAADELFDILLRTLGSDGLGTRMRPILQNALAALVGRADATLWDIKRLCEDASFRKIVADRADPYVKEFWTGTFPKLPKGSTTPIIYRLDRFLRSPTLRRVLCNPAPGLSIRRALSDNQILFLDLFGLSESQRMLIGLWVLSKVQLELMQREVEHAGTKAFVSLYCDEFQSFAGVSVSLWRELLSRGRKYGLALTLANQYPNQLPTDLRNELFGNVNSMAAFVLGARDAAAVNKELLTDVEKKDGVWALEPIPVHRIADQRVGHAVVKLAGGRAVEALMNAPLSVGREHADELMEASWGAFGSPPPPEPVGGREPPEPEPPPAAPVVEPDPTPREVPRARVEREERTAGRGGEEHKYLQALIRGWGEDAGFISRIEEQVEGGWVDVGLEKEGQRIACEVAISSSVAHEVANVKKCLAAGFDEVLVVSRRTQLLTQLAEALPDDVRGRVQLLTPAEVYPYLAPPESDLSADPESERTIVAGYEVTTRRTEGSVLDEQARRRAVHAVLNRLRKESK